MSKYLAIFIALLCLMGQGPTYAAFIPLGDLPGGLSLSDARGVSADGSVVVGTSVSASGFEAFRWTEAGGMVGLGFLPGFPVSDAVAASANGSVVVGTGVGPQDQAFRWTQETGIVGLGFLPGYAESIAFGVSADGSVVVGNSKTISGQKGQFQAFRWTAEGGMVGLGFLLPGGFSSAEGVSANGRIVVGASDSISGRQAFLWTEEGGMIGLGDLPGRSFDSFAHNVSANGSVVVGISDSASGFEAFRWTKAGGMVGLGFLPGDVESDAFGVSADGSVIVGRSHNPGANRAFIWDTIHGMQDLRDVLISQGDDLTGWELIEARDVSADGRTITGRGRNPAGQEEAWLARLDLQLSVALDVRPGSVENPVNPKSNGVIPVAILRTNSFDASTIDQASLRFGPGQALAEGSGHLEDVNGDGQLDLVLHFRTQDSGIQCGDTSVSITGQTVDGTPIQGFDSITTVGCKPVAAGQKKK